MGYVARFIDWLVGRFFTPRIAFIFVWYFVEVKRLKKMRGCVSMVKTAGLKGAAAFRYKLLGSKLARAVELFESSNLSPRKK
jgi:hypothetical protein